VGAHTTVYLDIWGPLNSLSRCVGSIKTLSHYRGSMQQSVSALGSHAPVSLGIWVACNTGRQPLLEVRRRHNPRVVPGGYVEHWQLSRSLLVQLITSHKVCSENTQISNLRDGSHLLTQSANTSLLSVGTQSSWLAMRERLAVTASLPVRECLSRHISIDFQFEVAYPEKN
jgi:hypothetical protein